jgi:hypothetical protein
MTSSKQDERSTTKGTAKAVPFCLDTAICGLERLNVLCLPALGALHHVELNCLTLLKGAEALRLNGGVVDEYIFSALAADESKSLGVVKPLHCSLFHIA